MKPFFPLLLLFIFCFSSIFSQNNDSIIIAKNRLLTKKFTTSVGVFSPSKITKVAVDGNVPNEIIDLGKSLDFDNKESAFTFNFAWRFSKNNYWSVILEYFKTTSANQGFTSKEINWGEVTYPKGTEVKGAFNFSLYRIFFGRVISKGNKHELIGGIGVHALNISTYLQGITYIDNLPSAVNETYDYEKHTVTLIAPVPNIGFKYMYAPTEKWSFSARIDWFSLNTSGYAGYLWDFGPSVTYQLINNLNMGVSYRYFNTSLDVKKRLWKGNVEVLYQGPIFFASYSF